MHDAEHLVVRLQAVEEALRDLAYEKLRAGTEDGDAEIDPSAVSRAVVQVEFTRADEE